MDREKWIQQNTALLVIHGIGSQLPIQTIDEFVRTLLEAYGDYAKNFETSHQVAPKPRNTGTDMWYDNFIRITNKKDRTFHLDIYEYYWANLTEDKTSLGEISQWTRKVALGARRFFKRNSELGKKCCDKSIFFSKDGIFRPVVYRIFLTVIIGGSFLGASFCEFLKKFGIMLPMGDFFAGISNTIGDIAIYNVTDPKKSSYEIRKTILDGAVSSLRYLLEPGNSKKVEDGQEPCYKLRYDRVIVAGHSLGSQIAFDAINRLTHLVTQGAIKAFDKDGNIVCSGGKKMKIAEILQGLVTFGSPLDKIAFFLREHVDNKGYLRFQMLRNFHCFKQRDWLSEEEKKEIKFELLSPFNKIFDDILWHNYYDSHDYVSGYLSYYDKVKNIDCCFRGRWHSFTHSLYWKDKKMFGDIIDDFICS